MKLTKRTSERDTNVAPSSSPGPVTTESHPSGRPASPRSSAKARAERGVAGAGLSTTGQPAAIAGATLCAARFKGKLNGVMAPTTPIGTRMANPSRPAPEDVASIGTTSPESTRASAAERVRVSTHRATSARDARMGFPASRAMILAKDSFASESSDAARKSTWARSRCTSPRSRCAKAEALARSMSLGVQEGTSAISRPSYGLLTGYQSATSRRPPAPTRGATCPGDPSEWMTSRTRGPLIALLDKGVPP